MRWVCWGVYAVPGFGGVWMWRMWGREDCAASGVDAGGAGIRGLGDLRRLGVWLGD